MKLKKRIVPFTTVILCDDKDFNDLILQTVEWCSSDSFNPAGKAYLVNCESYTISIVNRLREKKVKPKKEFSKLSLIYFILKVKPSLLINFSQKPIYRHILFFSRAGRKAGYRNLFSLIFADITFKKTEAPILRDAAPYLFNSTEKDERFGYNRSTSFRGKAWIYEKGTVIVDDENNIELDLGNIPDEPAGEILWIPRRTTTKTVWTDFVVLTYFAQKENCKITVQVRSEKEYKSISTIFFIKGRKSTMDKYLNFIHAKTVEEILDSQADKTDINWIVFSFGLTTEYNRVRGKLEKINGNNINLTTIKRIQNG